LKNNMEKNIQLIVIQIIQVEKERLNKMNKNDLFLKIHIVKHMNNNGIQQYKMDK
jgi:hypothetical protein